MNWRATVWALYVAAASVITTRFFERGDLAWAAFSLFLTINGILFAGRARSSGHAATKREFAAYRFEMEQVIAVLHKRIRMLQAESLGTRVLQLRPSVCRLCGRLHNGVRGFAADLCDECLDAAK